MQVKWAGCSGLLTTALYIIFMQESIKNKCMSLGLAIVGPLTAALYIHTRIYQDQVHVSGASY